MDLCTVTNDKFLTNSLNLIESYKKNSDNESIFLYYFNVSKEKIFSLSRKNEHINFIEVPAISEYIYNPKVFLYKTYAIYDCMKKSDGFIYSDASNVFNKKIKIENFLIDDSLFLPYNHKKLLNKYWTTKKCIQVMDSFGCEMMPQYWAGFQAYKKNKDNEIFVEDMFKYMLMPEVALPDTSIKYPDGTDSECVEHRQDQSVFSILINKHFRHQKFDPIRQQIFGDWQTFKSFDSTYQHDLENCYLSSRESKFNFFRFYNG